MDDPRLLTSRHIVFNLSRPEKSLMLLAPLATNAGGWGLCQPTLFASTADPGYRAILEMIEAGKRYLEGDSTRFDGRNFKPRHDWVREMKRYGILPECTQPEEVKDVYAVEQAYWKSLWPQ